MIVYGITIASETLIHPRRVMIGAQQCFAVRENDDASWSVTVACVNVADTVAVESAEDFRARDLTRTRVIDTRVWEMISPDITQQLVLTSPMSPGVIALTIELDHNLDMTRFGIDRAGFVIDESLTFDDVDERLRATPPIGDHVRRMYALARSLREKRAQYGADIRYNAEGTWHPFRAPRLSEPKAGFVIMSELLLLANAAAATHARKEQLPVIFFNHMPPQIQTTFDPDADTIDLHFDSRQFAKSAALQTEAWFDNVCTGNMDVACTAFAYFLSPLSRYCDLVNQRALLGLEQPDLAHIAEHLTEQQREIINDHAERREVRRRSVTAVPQANTWPADTLRSVLPAEASPDAVSEIGTGGAIDRVLSENIDRFSPEVLALIIFHAQIQGKSFYDTIGGAPPSVVRRAVERIAQAPDLAGPILQALGDKCGVNVQNAIARSNGRWSAHCLLKSNSSSISGRAQHANKTTAITLAMVDAIAHCAGLPEYSKKVAESPVSVSRPFKALVLDEPPKRTSIEARHPRLVLNELALALAWPLPTFTTTSFDDSGQTVYTCTATLMNVDRPHRRASATERGNDTREAERATAATLLAILGVPMDNRRAEPAPSEDSLRIDPVQTLIDLAERGAITLLTFDARAENNVYTCNAALEVANTSLTTNVSAEEEDVALFWAAARLLTMSRARIPTYAVR